MLTQLFRFLKDPKTPDSSFYMTILTLVGLLAHSLSGSSNPTFIAAGAVLTGLYTVGHKISEGLAATAKPSTPAVPSTPETIAAVAEQTAAQVTDQLLQKSVDLGIRLPQPGLDASPPPAEGPPAASA